MNKRLKLYISVALAMMLAVAMSACAQKTETGEIQGKLTQALEDSIVVESGGEATEFKTDAGTVYYLGATDHLTINDVVSVKYHKQGNKYFADVVTLKNHVQEKLIFSGTVSDIHDSSVTVTGTSLTVEFVKGAGTEIDGELSNGDEVEVEYTGDLSEYPVAKVIRVTAENENTKLKTVSGIVNEFTSKTIGVSIDSAHSYKFGFTAKTKVSGVDNYVKIGDTVTVTFEGDPDNSPDAIEIQITKKGEELKKTISGTLKTVGDKQIVLSTDASGKSNAPKATATSYIFKVDKYTKFTGEKPAPGLKATITYYGQLGSEATATIVNCAKGSSGKVTKYKVVFMDGMGNTLKTQKVEKGKSATAPAEPERSGYTFSGWDKSFKKVTSDLTVTAQWTKNPDPKPTPEQPVTTQGTITHWTTSESNTFGLKPDSGDEITLSVGDFTNMPAGYVAEVGDTIKATYLQSDMKATVIELVKKHEDPPVPEVPVVTEGVITHWTTDESNTFGLKPADGGEITLSVGDFTKMPAGYFAEAGDTVKATYLQSDMKATRIDLVSKHADPQPDDQSKPEEQTQPEEQTKPDEQASTDDSSKKEDAAPAPEKKEEEPAPASEPEPESKDKEPAEILVETSATIIEGNESERTAEMKLDTGETVTLKVDKNTDIASGYFPQKDDKVKLTYDKNSMTLRKIQLVERPSVDTPSESNAGTDSAEN